MKIKWQNDVYEVRALNAKEYLAIEKIVRQAKDIATDEPLSMEGGDFTIGLVVASTTKQDMQHLDWDEVVKMPAKLFQALSKAANDLNILSAKEEQELFFESSTAEEE